MRSAIAGICLALPLVAGLASPSLGDDREEANREMVRAVMAWNEAEKLIGDDALVARRRIELLEDVVERLESIVTKHSGSDLAVRLVTGEKIGPLSLERARFSHEDALKSQEARCGFVSDADCVYAMALDAADELLVGREYVALPAIAVSLAEGGRIEEADRLLEEVDPDSLSAWERIPLAKARKDPDAILEVIAEAKLDENSNWGFEAVRAAAALAAIGEDDKAMSLARSLQSEEIRGEAIGEMIHAMVARGDAEKAREVLEGLPPGKSRNLARERMSLVMSEAGLIEDAMLIAESIDDEAWRDLALVRLLNPRDDEEAFNAAMERIEAALTADRPDLDELRSSLLPAKIRAYTLGRDFERAVELAQSDPRDLSRNIALQYIAKQQAEFASVEDALETVSLIDAKYQAALGLSSIAGVLVRQSSLSEAIAIVERIEDSNDRNNALCRMGVELAEGGMVTEALDHLSEMDAGERCRAMSLAQVAAILARSE